MRTYRKYIVILFLIVSFLPVAAESPGEKSELRKKYVGVYLADVSGFDLKEGRFQADFYIWMKWLGETEDDWKRFQNPPIIFRNGEIGKIQFIRGESDGLWQSVRWRVQGTFRGTFPLQRFPFDSQELPLELEMVREHGVLAADLTASGMSKSFSITGWAYEPYFRARSGIRPYPTDFGSAKAEGRRAQVRFLEFRVILLRPFAAYIIKLILPLAIIVGMALLAIFLPAGNIDARVGMIITALLACVALNLSLSDSLPEVPYLVTADKFFVGSYIMILVALVETIFVYRFDQEDPAKAMRLDRISYWVLPSFMLLAILVGVGAAVISENGEELAVGPVEQSFEKRPVSKRKVLKVNIVSLKSAQAYDMGKGFLRRGLFEPRPGGKKQNLLLNEVPDPSSDTVRFLPGGGMRVRWQLRPENIWSDKREITASDLKFSLALDKDRLREKMVQVDDYTLDVYYKQRLFKYLKAFDVYPRRHLKSAFSEKKGRKKAYTLLKTTPVPRNGPYILKEFKAKKKITFGLNPNYQGPKPLIENIEASNNQKTADGKSLRVVPAIKEGIFDISPAVSSVSAKEALATPGVEMRPNPRKYFYYLKPGISKAPFNDLRVRRALAFAVNRRPLVNIYDSINGKIAHSYRAPEYRDYARNAPSYEFNPSKARGLLVQAGLKLPVQVEFFTSKVRPIRYPGERAALSIIADLEKSGFRVKRTAVKSVWSKTKKADFAGLALRYSSWTNNPARFWNVPYVGGQFQSDKLYGAYDSDARDLFQRLESNLFTERREMLSRRLQVLVAEKLPIIPLMHTTRYTVYNSKLKGVMPLSDNYWWNIEHWYFE